MWTFGTKVEPKRPACPCLVALPSILNPRYPMAWAIIDLEDWPHWQGWCWILVGIDPGAEVALEAWQATHPEG